jgi:hypothetical protein
MALILGRTTLGCEPMASGHRQQGRRRPSPAGPVEVWINRTKHPIPLGDITVTQPSPLAPAWIFA